MKATPSVKFYRALIDSLFNRLTPLQQASAIEEAELIAERYYVRDPQTGRPLRKRRRAISQSA